MNEILEGNKLIAEFMGYKHRFNFHKDWNDLMPVVEKIGKVPSISITIEYFTVEHGNRNVCSCEIKRTFWPKQGTVEEEKISYLRELTDKIPAIENIHGRIINFLTWYNQNKTS